MDLRLEQYEIRGGGICGEVLDVSATKTGAPRAYKTLQPLEIPEWKLGSVSICLVVGLPPTQRKNNAIWLIMD